MKSVLNTTWRNSAAVEVTQSIKKSLCQLFNQAITGPTTNHLPDYVCAGMHPPHRQKAELYTSHSSFKMPHL